MGSRLFPPAPLGVDQVGRAHADTSRSLKPEPAHPAKHGRSDRARLLGNERVAGIGDHRCVNPLTEGQPSLVPGLARPEWIVLCDHPDRTALREAVVVEMESRTGNLIRDKTPTGRRIREPG